LPPNWPATEGCRGPLTCIDGLVFDRLVNGGEVQREALEGLVAAALR